MNGYVHSMTVSDTRRRIVKAVRDLHEEVGPAATTITGIAERAGVQRLTVYRHFPDDGALIGACSADWAEEHPLPDPTSWSGIERPAERLSTALDRIYAYFRRGAPMLGQVLRDEPEVPELAEVMAPWWDYMREVAGGLAAGWGVEPDRQRLVRAAVGHALAFTTWRSLSDEGLSDDDAVEVMAGWVEGLAHPCDDPGDG
jgi:AcrR family transcriptional regulator